MSSQRYDVGILGVWSGCNYGSIATYYALNKVISDMGYSVLMIDKPRLSEKKDVELEMTHSRRFAYEHYHISKSYRIQDMHELNELCDSFVMGSDQVWNYGISKNFGKSYYLDFADGSKKKIAYAASFGHGIDFAPEADRRIISELMGDFDAISVRESDGVRICRDVYGIKAVQVLDPVFLADRRIFDALAERSRVKENEKYVATYILDPTPEKIQLMRNVSQRLGYKLINMLDGLPWLFKQNKEKLGLDAVEDLQVEEWIYLIKNCEFLITDSCHGASFGILYNRRMIALTNSHRGVSRFASLADLFDMKDRVLTNPLQGIDNDSLLNDMDYEKINAKLETERRRCGIWLKNALELPEEKQSLVHLPDRAVSAPKVWKTIKCTGCGACANVCPVDAITMLPNNEGFMNPVVDYDKCINCGLCAKKCIALEPQYRNDSDPDCYAFQASDEIRAVSSSGGVFSVAAECILDKGGYVAGAVYNEDYSVKHTIISDKKELWEMRGSKYMQSDTGDVYKKVKVLLVSGKLVLFTGLPCHVAALYSYLGDQKYDNLYTMDLVCHGITSQKVFRKFHKDVLQGKKLKELQFKAKQPWGWHAGTNAEFEDGTKYSVPLERCPYFIAYLKNISKNKTCGECQFNRFPRQADLSIGDFWGIQKFNPEFNDKKGTSEVLVNNEHGRELLDTLRPAAKLLELVPVRYALDGNPVMRHPYRMHKNREYFFNNLEKADFAKLTLACLHDSFQEMDDKALAELEPNLHGLYFLAKAVMLNCKGRKIVTWGHGPRFEKILKTYFGLSVSFRVYLRSQHVNGTSVKLLSEIQEKSAEYYLVSLARAYDVEAGKILKDYGYVDERDCIFRIHKPILLENFDLSKGSYSDIYGNQITGAAGVLKRVVFRGLNSRISLEKNVRIGTCLEFDMADNGTVEIGEGCRFIDDIRFQLIGNNSTRATVRIGKNCRFLNALIKLYGHYRNTLIVINNECTFESNLELHANSGKKLVIGQDCMFSHDIDVWAGDGHSIFDVETGKNTNSDYDNIPEYKNEIIIGDHVWVSKKAFILAGTNIGTGSIVGAQSVVKGKYPNNCVIAGNPSRVVKCNAAWSRDMTATDIGYCGAEKYVALTGENKISQKKTVLILGGSGRMSSQLTRLCISNGDDVTIAVRGKHKLDDSIASVKKIIFDRLDEAKTRSILANKFFDIVFDCSALVPQCVEWVLSSIKTDRYIYVSSFETYANKKYGYDLSEDKLPITGEVYETNVRIGEKAWYARGKYYSELLIADKYPELNYAIVRIPFVMSLMDEDYGDELSSRVYKYVSAVIEGRTINAKNLDQRYNFVENTDEANFLYFLAGNDFKGVINYASQGSITMREIINYVGDKTGKKAILDVDAETFPFTRHPGVTMNLDKCISLSYEPMKLDEWLPLKIDKYIAHCKTNNMQCEKIEKNKIKRWLVTGGDTEFGQTFALKLRNSGYKIAVTGRDFAKMNKLPDDIVRIECNICNLDSCRKSIEYATEKLGKIDVLVINTNLLHNSTFEETPEKISRNIIEENYWGVSNMVKSTIPHMRNNRSGTIIAISSASGFRAWNYRSYYVASKFAVENLLKNLKFECQKFLRVMTVEMGEFSMESLQRQIVIPTQIEEYENLSPVYLCEKTKEDRNSKAIDAVIDMVNFRKLPRTLILDRIAYEQFPYFMDTFDLETEKYKSISISTDEVKRKSIDINGITLPRNKDLKIQNWLITGASEGFGKVLALRLYQLGYTVAVTSRNVSKLDSMPEGIHKIESQLDSISSCEKVIQTAISQMGTVDVLVNNATSNCWCSFEECPDDIMKRVFYVNYTVPQYMIKVLLPYMRKSRNGTVVNITSVAGIQPRARVSTYSAAKAALEGLTRSLKSECQNFARFMAVELVCMRTRIMIHNPVIDSQIADYQNLGRYTHSINNIPNSKDVAAQQIINVINKKEIPQSLLIGTESYMIAKDEIKRDREDFEQYKEITLSVIGNN